MIVYPNDEILAVERRLTAKWENDVHRIFEDLRQRQNEGEYEVIVVPPRRCSTTNHVLHGSSGSTTTLHNQSTPGTP